MIDRGQHTSSPVHVGIVSSQRPGNVDRMHTFCIGMAPRWYVPEAEADAYTAAGADVRPVVGAPPFVGGTRDAVLNDAFAVGAVAVILDDDLTSLRAWSPTAHKAYPMTVAEAIAAVLDQLARTAFRLGGISATSNALWLRQPYIKKLAFIRDFYVVLPSEPRHAHDLEFSEDYDFTIKHVLQYGGVVRHDLVLPTFRKRDNPGGLQATRTPEGIAAARRRLAERWPEHIIWPHPRHGTQEVDFRWNHKILMS